MRSREWAVRCIHERSLHEHNCFITLTYNDEHLPYGETLVLDHYQRFMKRLRKQYGDGIRFFHCGEYGETNMRPHYHALLFNHSFADQQFFTRRNGIPLFTSEALSELWPLGFSTVGAVTFESAAYVARYIMKKVTGDAASDRYDWADPETGELIPRRREYITMSRRPGIGRGWLDKYGAEVLDHDSIIIDGKQLKVPRFYDKVLEEVHAEAIEANKRARIREMKRHAWNNTPERLEVRRKVQEAKLKRLTRDL